MWSSSRMIRSGVVAAALVLLPILSACSGFTPVYGTPSLSGDGVAISYAPPGNRLEQLIYEDLSLRLGHAAGTGPNLKVSTSQRTTSLTSDTVTSAVSQKQAIVTASVTLTGSDGVVLFSGQRIATADYTEGPQILSNKQAQQDAFERAAHQLADTVRLTVLGALTK